jgi:hypothetical protein
MTGILRAATVWAVQHFSALDFGDDRLSKESCT